MKTSRFLRIYLQDHDAVAYLAVQLIRRTRSNNDAGPLADFLDDLADFAARHRSALGDVMQRLEVRPRREKRAALWTAERLGRLKLNGRLVRYSELSRLVELEGLTLITTMALSLWEALDAQLADDPRVTDVSFDELIAEAERRRAALREHRVAAAAALSS